MLRLQSVAEYAAVGYTHPLVAPDAGTEETKFPIRKYIQTCIYEKQQIPHNLCTSSCESSAGHSRRCKSQSHCVAQGIVAAKVGLSLLKNLVLSAP